MPPPATKPKAPADDEGKPPAPQPAPQAEDPAKQFEDALRGIFGEPKPKKKPSGK